MSTYVYCYVLCIGVYTYITVLLVMIIVDPCVHMSDFLSLIRYCTVVILSSVGVLYKA